MAPPVPELFRSPASIGSARGPNRSSSALPCLYTFNRRLHEIDRHHDGFCWAETWNRSAIANRWKSRALVLRQEDMDRRECCVDMNSAISIGENGGCLDGVLRLLAACRLKQLMKRSRERKDEANVASRDIEESFGVGAEVQEAPKPTYGAVSAALFASLGGESHSLTKRTAWKRLGHASATSWLTGALQS